MRKIRDMNTWRLRKPDSLDETVIRFNWGYHDGADDFLKELTRKDGLTISTIQEYHYDYAYATGYVTGWRDAKNGDYTGNSSKAWLHCQHQAALTSKYAPYRKYADYRSYVDSKTFKLCTVCGIYPADYPAKTCSGCDSYLEHLS